MIVYISVLRSSALCVLHGVVVAMGNSFVGVVLRLFVGSGGIDVLCLYF